jgi:hypothetical protein
MTRPSTASRRLAAYGDWYHVILVTEAPAAGNADPPQNGITQIRPRVSGIVTIDESLTKLEQTALGEAGTQGPASRNGRGW